MKTHTARSQRASASHESAEFSFSSASMYADKDEYLAKNVIFTIKVIEFEESAGYEGTDRWAISVAPDDGRPDEIITLQANDKRDAELQAAADHITKHGPIANTKLVKSGKAYYFRKATESAPT